MISGFIIGDRLLLRQLGTMPARAKQRLDATVMGLGYELEAYIKARKLTGQVLGVRTGRLRASISQSSARQGGDSRSHFESTPTRATYTVGTNVDYGAAWEFGSKARTIVPVHKLALKFEIAGVTFFRKRVNIPAQPARPFLAPSLQEMKPTIISRIERVLGDVARESLRP